MMSVVSSSCSEGIFQSAFELRFGTRRLTGNKSDILPKKIGNDILRSIADRDLSHCGAESVCVSLRTFRPFAWFISCLVDTTADACLDNGRDAIRVLHISSKSFTLRRW